MILKSFKLEFYSDNTFYSVVADVVYSESHTGWRTVGDKQESLITIYPPEDDVEFTPSVRDQLTKYFIEVC